MADNLIFPIGFDLEKAVNEAGQQWDKKYAKKLEVYMAKFFYSFHIKDATLYPSSGCLITPTVAMRYSFPINSVWVLSNLFRLICSWVKHS